MLRHGCILLAFLTALVWSNAHADPACRLSPKKLSQKIKQTGASDTLQDLYDTHPTNWEKLLSCIGTGQDAWIGIAVTLRPAADGATAEGLDAAIGEALGNNPEQVLGKGLPAFDLPYICSGPDVDDPRFDSYALSMKEIAKRIDALGRIKDSKPNLLVDKCRIFLIDSKKNIARFYGVTETK